MRDILDAVSKGEISKTTAMHKASMNFRVFQPYVKLLIDQGLISAREESTGATSRIWLSITDKGKEVCVRMDNLMEGIR